MLVSYSKVTKQTTCKKLEGIIMKKLITLIISGFLISLLLNGCGWHLRNSGTAQISDGGTAQILGDVGKLYVDGDQKSLLYRSVIKFLEYSNVNIAENSKSAEIVITLVNQRSKSRTATVSSSARVSELEIIELVDIIISTGNGKILLPKTTLSKEKFFTYDEDNVSTNDEENKMLQREMTRGLAKNIIRRLNATLKMINKNEPQS